MSFISAEADSATAFILEPLPTPRWGSQSGFGAFSVRAFARIHAAPDVVLDCLLETSSYPVWNRFVPGITFPHASISDPRSLNSRLGVGCQFVEHVDMHGNGRSSGLVKMKLLMTAMEELGHGAGPGYKVVWLGQGYPDWALRSERVHNISQVEDGISTYEVWETFSGPLAFLVRLFVGKTLVKRFRQWNQELKIHAQGTSHRSKP